MIVDLEKQLEQVFLSYDKILERLKIKNIKTKSGKEITHKDLRQAISVMQKKHPTCRWQSTKIRNKKYYILIEGYYWLIYVYFQNEKKQIDADIEFFLKRIEQYEKILSLERKDFFTQDIYVDDLAIYFHRKHRTVEKAIIKMLKNTNEDYRFIENKKFKISKKGVEYLCKNYFKKNI